jgi:hypothetical protein
MLFCLSFLYLLGALAAFAVAVAGRGVSGELHATMVRHGLYHAFAGGACLSAVFCRFRRSRYADTVTAIAAVLTNLLAFKDFIGALIIGFKFYNLIEPLVIIPCTILILWKLAKSRV